MGKVAPIQMVGINNKNIEMAVVSVGSGIGEAVSRDRAIDAIALAPVAIQVAPRPCLDS